jgi:hypothetical protein
MAKIEKQAAVDAVDAFVKDLVGWLDTPDPIGGFGQGFGPIPSGAREIPASKVAALVKAIKGLPAA